MNKGDGFTFEITKNLGTLAKLTTGWTRELNLVEWNGNKAKFDIRDWDSEHAHMSKGITLHEDEAKLLSELLNKHFRDGAEKGSEE